MSRTETGPITVLLVDSMAIIREGIRLLLAQHPPLRVVGEATDSVSALQLAQSLRPQVVVINVSASRHDGVDTTSRIRAILPRTRVIAFTASHDPSIQEAMLTAGASAFLTEDCSGEQLVSAITDAHNSAVLLHSKKRSAGQL